MLGGLATDPKYQGKGYGGSLVDTFVSVADRMEWQRKTWLVSSNINNSGFYQMHGFIAVKEYVLGDTDESWVGKPVVIQIVRTDFKDL